LASQPFHALAADADAVRQAFRRLLAAPADSPARDAATDSLAGAVQQLKDRLDACRLATNGVYAHLEAHGISVGLVFRLRQLRERVVRVRELMDCLFSPSPHTSTARLLAKLVMLAQERSSLRALIASNATLLAAKMAERSAETGEHYITRTAGEYRQMLRQAAGGGMATAGTTLLKFAVMSAGLSAFWGGFWVGLLYAVSFVFIQLMHWTLATKQPAMTAPAMAEKLGALHISAGHADTSDADTATHEAAAIDGFVDDVRARLRKVVPEGEKVGAPSARRRAASSSATQPAGGRPVPT
jgi:site-specific recombinase